MIKKILLQTLFFLLVVPAYNQVPGYYNGTEGKSGEALKTVLNSIISGHVDFSYSDAKYILNYADSDPGNENNVILFYTKRSQSNTSWGSNANDINREHVWAKSHGDFAGVRPMDGDAFNLHPSDASVNILKSNYDFDECSSTGTYIDEADAYFTDNQFEPSDAVKGEVARTIFYMAVRYEGNNGELDLEVVDRVGTYPDPEHGKLSTLLQWNRDFPPTDLERRRNERVYEAQNNRNPFIDNPGFADLIWGGSTPSGIKIGNLHMEQSYPYNVEPTTFYATIQGNDMAAFYHGSEWDSEENSIEMQEATDDLWTAEFDLTLYDPGDLVHYKIVAADASTDNVIRGSYRIPAQVELTAINEVQGSGNTTPLNGETVSVAGVVTASFDNAYYIQSGTEPRSGICIYDVRRGNIGDYVVLTGEATEFNNLTEIADLSYFYVFDQENNFITPVEISIADANEDYEGMLVTIRNVTFLEGDAVIPVGEAMTLNFTDGTNTMTVYSRYNSRLGGKTVPSGTVDVTGIVSQYQDNYQLLIHRIEDIETGEDNEAPLLTGVVVNDANWIELSFSEKIDKTSAELVDNYSISGGVVINGAYLYNETKVLLYVSGLQETDYTVTVKNVADLRGNSIGEVQMDFHSDYTGIGLTSGISQEMSVYPNPSSGRIYVTIPYPGNQGSLYLMDINGKQVFNNHVLSGQRTLTLDVEDLNTGIYILQYRTLNTCFQKRIQVK